MTGRLRLPTAAAPSGWVARSVSVLSRLGEVGVVPVVEFSAPDEAAPLLEALVAGGCPVAEITLRSNAGLGAIRALRRSYPEALIGAGTVGSLEAANAVVEAGAQFIVSPSTNPELIRFCDAVRVPVFPGACTPTEVDVAVRAGADAVKFFPAEAIGGIPVLKALAGPFRDVSFVPTGGINESNLADYLRLPNVAACGGSWIVAPALLADGRFDQIEALTREAVQIAEHVQAGATA
jgi:2-dehydro-3-deoxyphosphogluconate aldolase / (4S)-4-hydroxy-2-oxoglutarate aldolase